MKRGQPSRHWQRSVKRTRHGGRKRRQAPPLRSHERVTEHYRMAVLDDAWWWLAVGQRAEFELSHAYERHG